MAQQNFAALRAAALDGRTRNIYYRQAQLEYLQKSLTKEASAIQEAIVKDSGVTSAEAKIEFSLALGALRDRYAELDPKKELEVEYKIAKKEDATESSVGAGIVIIEPATYNVFYSVVAPMSAAIAAGNCLIVRLDQNTRETSALLSRILPSSIDHDAIAISQGPITDESLLGASVRVIQDASDAKAAKSNEVVSVPSKRTIAIVDRTADFNEAAKNLINARFGFRGKSPYAPDVVLVNEFVKKDLLQALVNHSITAGNQVLQNGDAEKRTLRDSGFKALVSELQNADGKLVTEETNGAIVDVKKRSPGILNKKINEPVLQIVTMKSLDDAIDFVTDDNQTYLAAYHFGKPDIGKYLAQFVPADVTFVNHIPLEILVGPAFPSSLPVTTLTKYPTSLFRRATPAYINPSSTASSQLVSKAANLASSISERTIAVSSLYQNAIADLVPVQKRRKPMTASFGFFEHAFLLHFGLLFFSTVGVTVGGVMWLRRGGGWRPWR